MLGIFNIMDFSVPGLPTFGSQCDPSICAITFTQSRTADDLRQHPRPTQQERLMKHTADTAAAAGSALDPLESLAGLGAAGLLALHDATVARQEPGGFQRRPQLRVPLLQRAADAVTQRLGLASHAAAFHRCHHVEAAQQACHLRAHAACVNK